MTFNLTCSALGGGPMGDLGGESIGQSPMVLTLASPSGAHGCGKRENLLSRQPRMRTVAPVRKSSPDAFGVPDTFKSWVLYGPMMVLSVEDSNSMPSVSRRMLSISTSIS